MKHVSLLVAVVAMAAGIRAVSAQETTRFEYALSTGPFGLPEKGRSIDWALVNNAPDSQEVRVTVWELNFSGAKVKADPGSITWRVGPGASFHNANGIGRNGPFRRGFYYEVVVEVNSRLVLPSVDIWSDDWGTVIPGSRIGPAGFVELRPQE